MISMMTYTLSSLPANMFSGWFIRWLILKWEITYWLCLF